MDRRTEREREILPDPVATRVLQRASELEALRRAGVALILTGILVSRTVTPVPANVVEETFTLRCIPANEAASMLRPILVRTGTISFSMRIPTELRITGSPEQLRQARDILAEQDVPGSDACRVR